MMIFAMLLSATVAMAQNQNCNQRPKQMSADEMTTEMVNKLDLSNAQKSKVQKLNKKYESLFKCPGAPAMKGGQPPQRPNEANGSSNSGDKRPELSAEQKAKMKKEMKERKAQREAYEKDLKKILSESQYKSYEKMRPQHGGKHGSKGDKCGKESSDK